MQKKNFARIVLISILVALILASIGFYIADIVRNNTPPTQNLFKALAVVFLCCGGIVRLFAGRGRRSLGYYEGQYQKHIKGAFINFPLNRKKLLCAIRLYNEDRFDKALKYLSELQDLCQEQDDLYAVGIFTGLTLTDAGRLEDAVAVYNMLIHRNLATSTVYGNLGHLHSALGNSEEAIDALQLAIEADKSNPAPYNNLANLYFDLYDFDNAKKYANEALEINHKFYQSASLLAIIYSLEGDSEAAKKYSHIAVSGGQNPIKLQQAIEYYQAVQEDDDPENDTAEDDEYSK